MLFHGVRALEAFWRLRTPRTLGNPSLLLLLLPRPPAPRRASGSLPGKIRERFPLRAHAPRRICTALANAPRSTNPRGQKLRALLFRTNTCEKIAVVTPSETTSLRETPPRAHTGAATRRRPPIFRKNPCEKLAIVTASQNRNSREACRPRGLRPRPRPRPHPPPIFRKNLCEKSAIVTASQNTNSRKARRPRGLRPRPRPWPGPWPRPGPRPRSLGPCPQPPPRPRPRPRCAAWLLPRLARAANTVHCGPPAWRGQKGKLAHRARGRAQHASLPPSARRRRRAPGVGEEPAWRSSPSLRPAWRLRALRATRGHFLPRAGSSGTPPGGPRRHPCAGRREARSRAGLQCKPALANALWRMGAGSLGASGLSRRPEGGASGAAGSPRLPVRHREFVCVCVLFVFPAPAPSRARPGGARPGEPGRSWV